MIRIKLAEHPDPADLRMLYPSMLLLFNSQIPISASKPLHIKMLGIIRAPLVRGS